MVNLLFYWSKTCTCSGVVERQPKLVSCAAFGLEVHGLIGFDAISDLAGVASEGTFTDVVLPASLQSKPAFGTVSHSSLKVEA